MKKTFIIIVNFNSGDDLLRCIKLIEKWKIRNEEWKTIIVDNSSTDNSVDKVRERFPGVILIKNPINLGFAGGNNVGIKYALEEGADYVMFLNPDTILSKNTLPELLKVEEREEKVGIVGPKIYTLDNKIWSSGGEINKKRFSGGHRHYGKRDDGRDKKMRETDFISGCCMLVKRQVFEEIGLFDTRFFLYYEDVDFCFRAKKAGFKVLFVPKAVLYHSTPENSPLRSYFMARNHLLFLEKHSPLLIRFREFIRLPKTIWEHSQKNEKYALLGIRDYFLRRFGYRDYWS